MGTSERYFLSRATCKRRRFYSIVGVRRHCKYSTTCVLYQTNPPGRSTLTTGGEIHAQLKSRQLLTCNKPVEPASYAAYIVHKRKKGLGIRQNVVPKIQQRFYLFLFIRIFKKLFKYPGRTLVCTYMKSLYPEAYYHTVTYL